MVESATPDIFLDNRVTDLFSDTEENPKLASEYQKIRSEAAILSGGIDDLIQRASVYKHMYDASQGNHIFPLIAAHGALWGSSYFQLGIKLGKFISLKYLLNGSRDKRMAKLHKFADAFRNINRRVCLETYAAFHFSRKFGHNSEANKHICGSLLDKLNLCHSAANSGENLTPEERRSVFTAFFLWEQDTIVGPAVDKAVNEFDWEEIKSLALTPSIHFSYFPYSKRLKFNDFACKEERIEKGLQAFEIAAQVGWPKVELSLTRYNTMPRLFIQDSKAHFSQLYQDAGLNYLQNPSPSSFPT